MAKRKFATLMTFRQLRYFVAVCESGKINQVASELGISASAISSAIKELQGLAGVSLLERHRRGVLPTAEGRIFLRHCKTILASVVEAFQDISKTKQVIEGRLRLGTTVTVAGYFLSTPLARFQRAYRNIEVQVLEMERKELEDATMGGDLDIALMLVSNLIHGDKIASEVLVRSPRRLWTQIGHRLLQRERVTLADVANEPYIQLNSDDAIATTDSYWAPHGLSPNRVYQTQSVEAVRSMVATGRGVTVLSDMLYRPWSLEAERIECCDIADEIPPMDIGLIWRHDVPLLDTAQAIREYCRSEVTLKSLSSALNGDLSAQVASQK